MNDTVVIDTPEGIAAYRLACLIRALRLEIKTGMKMTRFPLLRVAQQYGVTARTKAKALAALEALYEETYGRTA